MILKVLTHIRITNNYCYKDKKDGSWCEPYYWQHKFTRKEKKALFNSGKGLRYSFSGWEDYE